MKKYMELIVQFKFVWSLFFTASIIIYTVVSMLLGNSSMEFLVIWQLILITMILTLIHYIVFGEFMLKSLSNNNRILFHFFLCYITMLLSANLLKWIVISNTYSMGIFTLVYILLYLSICWSLHIYYKATGEQLNNKLALYKQKKNIN